MPTIRGLPNESESSLLCLLPSETIVKVWCLSLYGYILYIVWKVRNFKITTTKTIIMICLDQSTH